MLMSITMLLLFLFGLRPLAFGQSPPCEAAYRMYVSVGTGLAFNVPLPLAIRQSGHPDLRLTARFDTRPFAEVPYYDVKVGMYRKPWAYELELVHHKLYLVNRPPEVGTFEITHGYNPILLNVVCERWSVALRVGAGIVLTHPQTTVRGLRFPESGGVLGWYVSGPAAQVSIGRQFVFGGRWFGGVEGKATAAYARIPVQNGSADVPNVALHGLVTLGFRF